MKRKQQHLAMVAMALLLVTAATGAAAEPQVDPAADMLLKRMGAVLGAAEEFTVTNTFTSDETVSTGEIVQLEGTVEIALRRPNGLRFSYSWLLQLMKSSTIFSLSCRKFSIPLYGRPFPTSAKKVPGTALQTSDINHTAEPWGRGFRLHPPGLRRQKGASFKTALGKGGLAKA